MARASQPYLLPAHLWSALGALFTATLVTLWNVMRNADPDVVLIRAFVSTVIVSMTLQSAIVFIRLTSHSRHRK